MQSLGENFQEVLSGWAGLFPGRRRGVDAVPQSFENA
jgi:hypothetical protein